ncbi:transcriptional regulator FtsR [Rothia aerolata]|uniref:MerR family transcriptional regulator n=1 Tax=Rothia aerolata TaxID=1812262 RepID=A0A917IKI1_9MICC|nr:MerR family transcriptional regulator [Rothia aerolata]GGH56350.1 MerR family transcriptional regulator [Rothia aerolata]
MADSSEATDQSQKVAKDKTIGQVLSALASEFPGISASKIRFLEDKGLVHPHRTNTGYRKYSADDVKQLRFILQKQRDEYLPLRVIKEKVDAGLWQDPPETVEEKVEQVDTSAPAAPVMSASVEPGKTFTLRELSAETETDMPLLRELITFGLLAEEGPYDAYDVVVTKVCAELTAHGLQPRHLRQFRAAAEREVGLVEMAVAPLASRRDEQSQAKAAERAGEIAQLCLRLHMALVASSMPSYE